MHWRRDRKTSQVDQFLTNSNKKVKKLLMIYYFFVSLDFQAFRRQCLMFIGIDDICSYNVHPMHIWSLEVSHNVFKLSKQFQFCTTYQFLKYWLDGIFGSVLLFKVPYIHILWFSVIYLVSQIDSNTSRHPFFFALWDSEKWWRQEQSKTVGWSKSIWISQCLYKNISVQL